VTADAAAPAVTEAQRPVIEALEIHPTPVAEARRAVAEALEVTPAPAIQYLSRREAREAEQRLAAAAQTPQPQVPRPEVFSFDSEVSSAPVVPTVEPASVVGPVEMTKSLAAPAVPSAPTAAASSAPWAQVPAATSTPLANPFAERQAPLRARLEKKTATKPKRSVKKKVSSFATIMAVAGFFASVSIPAIAASGPAAELLPLESAQGEVAQASLTVESEAVLGAKRESFAATTATDLASQRNNALKEANFAAYQTSGAREQGDDYPWFSELSNNQGGGLSPLNYYYRECVDFVAWRLNRDAGSTSAPFKWDWHNLTPNGGNAYQWKAAWVRNGWKTSTTPEVGSVAWFGYHVSYVTAVNGDGTVTLEEYNFSSDHLYGKRTIPATDVTLYLYAP